MLFPLPLFEIVSYIYPQTLLTVLLPPLHQPDTQLQSRATMTVVTGSDKTTAATEPFSNGEARGIINTTIDTLSPELRTGDNTIHSNPEEGYEEGLAHKTLTKFLEGRRFAVTRHAYGIDTSFEATFGSGGRQVVFCAEYDALPGIGHACGHNLIATSPLAAFLGAAEVLPKMKVLTQNL